MCLTVDRSFFRTVPFYLKISELLCCIGLWICVATEYKFSIYGGGGFVNFCSTLSFIMTANLFLLYLFGKIQVCPGPWVLIEVISIVSSVVLFLVCLIVASAATSTQEFRNSAIATAVVSGIEMIIYSVEFVLRFKVMRVTGFRFTAQMKSTGQTETDQSTQNNPSGPYIIGA